LPPVGFVEEMGERLSTRRFVLSGLLAVAAVAGGVFGGYAAEGGPLWLPVALTAGIGGAALILAWRRIDRLRRERDG